MIRALVGSTRWSWGLRGVLLVVITAWLGTASTHLRLVSDLAPLLPESPETAALSRAITALGGGDLTHVLVQHSDPNVTREVAQTLEQRLRALPSVNAVLDQVPVPTLGAGTGADPTLAWAYADATSRKSLLEALTPEGMRIRLQHTRALLLAPGSEVANDLLAQDPLRLWSIPWERPQTLAAAASGPGGSPFETNDGRAQLLLLSPKGHALRKEDAQLFTQDLDRTLEALRPLYPDVVLERTGGHVIATETQRTLERDLRRSGLFALLTVSFAFLLFFPRKRALWAILPPLALGTWWTLGLAALFPNGLSAIAVAFASVVMGVGMDTGIHVYAHLLQGRRSGLSPREAAAWARRHSALPTLLAATAAAFCFGALGLSSISALRQLGLLSAAGEILTAVAILAVTPELGALLETGPPPPPAPFALGRGIVSLTATPTRSRLVLAGCIFSLGLLGALGGPPTADALVAIRPRGVPALETQKKVFALFGSHAGQWMVLSEADDDLSAREQDEALVPTLRRLQEEGAVETFDSLATFFPTPKLMAERLATRNELHLPQRVGELRNALQNAGFDPDAFPSLLRAFETPAPPPNPPNLFPPSVEAFAFARHLGHLQGRTVVATFVRLANDGTAEKRLRDSLLAVAPTTQVTSYSLLDSTLRDTLRTELPRLLGAALLGVLATLLAAFRRWGDGILVVAALASELALLGLAMRALGTGFHAYNALILPALVGVTLDEGLFLLVAARPAPPRSPGPRPLPPHHPTPSEHLTPTHLDPPQLNPVDSYANPIFFPTAGPPLEDPIAQSLHTQGPLVLNTALTTAAGFAALIPCTFEGLRDVGVVGTLGVLAGLLSAFLIIPAGLRLSQAPAKVA